MHTSIVEVSAPPCCGGYGTPALGSALCMLGFLGISLIFFSSQKIAAFKKKKKALHKQHNKV